jgi:hypothetical protein
MADTAAPMSVAASDSRPVASRGCTCTACAPAFRTATASAASSPGDRGSRGCSPAVRLPLRHAFSTGPSSSDRARACQKHTAWRRRPARRQRLHRHAAGSCSAVIRATVEPPHTRPPPEGDHPRSQRLSTRSSPRSRPDRYRGRYTAALTDHPKITASPQTTPTIRTNQSKSSSHDRRPSEEPAWPRGGPDDGQKVHSSNTGQV